METCRIYLSGSMMNSSWEEQTKWRRQLTDAIKWNYEGNKNVSVFDPTQYYNFEEKLHKSEKEIFEFDLYNLRRSDLVVVNFLNSKSLGTMSELILAHELHIPVIGYNPNNETLHPWMECCVTRMCDSFKEVFEHVVDFYLN